MGRYAADEFYRQNSHWLDSPQEAYDLLYGGTKKPKALKPHRCPLCTKNFTTSQARRHHMRDVHDLSKKEINDALR